MKFKEALGSICRSVKVGGSFGSAGLAESLTAALAIGGDFPISAEVCSRISKAMIADETNLDEIVSIIMADVSLPLRILSLANHAFFARSTSTTTVSAAVRQLGFKHAEQLFGQIGARREFSQVFCGRSVAGVVLQESLLACAIAGELVGVTGRADSKVREQACITALLITAPDLLLAFYRPNIYASLYLKRLHEKQELDKMYHLAVGAMPVELSLAIVKKLHLPESYIESVVQAAPAMFSKIRWQMKDPAVRAITGSAFYARAMARTACSRPGSDALGRALKEAGQRLDVSTLVLREALDAAGAQINKISCEVGIDFISQEYGECAGAADKQAKGGGVPGLQRYLNELKACLSAVGEREGSARIHHAVLCTLYALVRGMRFDRAALFLWDSIERRFVLLAGLGLPFPEPCVLPSGELSESSDLPHIRALLNQETVFTGDLVFDDGWPFVIFPVISDGAVEGMFYADYKAPLSSGAGVHDFWLEPLDMSRQVAVVAVSEAWRAVPVNFH